MKLTSTVVETLAPNAAMVHDALRIVIACPDVAPVTSVLQHLVVVMAVVAAQVVARLQHLQFKLRTSSPWSLLHYLLS